MSKSGIRREASLYFVPFLLGSGKKAALLSAKILVKYGITPIVLEDKPSLWGALTPTYRFLRLSEWQSSLLLATQLSALACREPYCLPILIPCNERYLKAIEEQRERLECSFVLSSTESLFSDSPLITIP